MKRDFEHIYGCLIGGAIGDAISAPVKYMSYRTIQNVYGEKGVVGFTYDGNSQRAIVTDDTQLTLFTAEGLLRSIARARKKGIELQDKDVTTSVFRAYIRWLYTQGLTTPHWNPGSYDGWLVKVKKMHAYREPGITCITSLGKGIMGRVEKPINDSKKCGAIVKSAPVGILEEPERAFKRGIDIGAITHGHPTAYLGAGAVAMLIAYILEASTLEDAIDQVITRLEKEPKSEECIAHIQKALKLVEENPNEVTPEKIQSLGKGFNAHEALAISIYCCLVHKDDFLKAVLVATNHRGDSNATAALTGNILGAYIGAANIDEDLKQAIEVWEEIEQISRDLEVRFMDESMWDRKYPAW